MPLKPLCSITTIAKIYIFNIFLKANAHSAHTIYNNKIMYVACFTIGIRLQTNGTSQKMSPEAAEMCPPRSHSNTPFSEKMFSIEDGQ